MNHIEPYSKACIFCDVKLSKSNRSKEHVIPQWLLDFMKITGSKIQPTHYSEKGNIYSTRNHTLDNLLAGNVCEPCNSGWMSQLETDVMPILKALITDKRAVVDLNDEERQILGRWAAKTAFSLKSASNYLKNVPPEHYKFIRLNQHILPEKVFSFGQQHHGTRNFYWMQSSTWLVHKNTNNSLDTEELKNSSYKIAFQFGKLLLLVAYLPLENLIPVLWKGIHIPLIPKSGRCGWHDKEYFPWDDSEKSLHEFHFGLHAALVK
jgi:hypothetical protein